MTQNPTQPITIEISRAHGFVRLISLFSKNMIAVEKISRNMQEELSVFREMQKETIQTCRTWIDMEKCMNELD